MSTALKSPFCTVCRRKRLLLVVLVKYHSWSGPVPLSSGMKTRESFLMVEARTVFGPVCPLVRMYFSEKSMEKFDMVGVFDWRRLQAVWGKILAIGSDSFSGLLSSDARRNISPAMIQLAGRSLWCQILKVALISEAVKESQMEKLFGKSACCVDVPSLSFPS